MSPVIVIGAPRSGTKMLRELLKLHPEVCGALHEEEQVWCYGNPDKLSLSLQAADATEPIKQYIRNYYLNESLNNSNNLVIAKNVANSLRIEYVREIFPDSPIINILRDGRDASCSALKRWEKPLDTKYMIKNGVLKAKNFPVRQLPYFLKRQFNWFLQKKLLGRNQIIWWGPKFDDYEILSKDYSIFELCGIQWSRCVGVSLKELSFLDSGSYINIHYENLVLNPTSTMKTVFDFLNLPFDEQLCLSVKEYVSVNSIGNWKKYSEHPDFQKMLDIVEPNLEKIQKY